MFYVNQGLETTQWNHPMMNLELPHGWEQRVDEHGRALYINLHSGKPGLSVSVCMSMSVSVSGSVPVSMLRECVCVRIAGKMQRQDRMVKHT